MELTPLLDQDGRVVLKVYDYDGYRFWQGIPENNPRQHLQNLKNLKFSDSDVCVVAYPKSGTHWVYEIVNMLRNGNAEYTTLVPPSMDFVPYEQLKTIQNGIWNTHCYPEHIPKELLEKQCKIILVYRNPKDIAVSFFHFLKKLRIGYKMKDLSFEGFLSMFMEGKVPSGSWINWMKKWADFKQNHPDYPILLLSFEDMKQNVPKTVENISEFLDLKSNDRLIRKIAKQCEFTSMSKFKHENVPIWLNMLTRLKDDHVFYRKDTENELARKDKHWGNTHRAEAICKLRDSREGSRRGKYGGYLNVWPEDSDSEATSPGEETTETRKRKLKTDSNVDSDRNAQKKQKAIPRHAAVLIPTLTVCKRIFKDEEMVKRNFYGRRGGECLSPRRKHVCRFLWDL